MTQLVPSAMSKPSHFAKVAQTHVDNGCVGVAQIHISRDTHHMHQGKIQRSIPSVRKRQLDNAQVDQTSDLMLSVETVPSGDIVQSRKAWLTMRLNVSVCAPCLERQWILVSLK